MTYQIEVTRHYYGPRTTKHILQDENGEVTFRHRHHALALVKAFDAAPYETDHDESGRPSYRVVRGNTLPIWGA